VTSSGPRDPPRFHPDSVFLNVKELKAVEKEVLRLRGGKSKTTGGVHHKNSEQSTTPSGQKSSTADDDLTSTRTQAEDDKCEGPLLVPNSVLDGCESSFKATNELREKASTQFFDDTGLMALIC
jgi:hypothetical protein